MQTTECLQLILLSVKSSIAQPQSYAILDIVLAKGGPEACIAESYYSCM